MAQDLSETYRGWDNLGPLECSMLIKYWPCLKKIFSTIFALKNTAMLFLKIPMSNYRTKASFLHRIFFIIQSMLQQHCFLLQKGGIFFSTI